MGFFIEALNISKKNHGDEHVSVALILNSIGTVMVSLGVYDKALSNLEKAMQTRVNTYGEEHPSVATSLNNIGSAWRSLGEYQKGLLF